MKLVSKVEQEIEGNKWFETQIKKIRSETALTEKQLKRFIADAITYYLIDAISFRMFLEVIDQIGERPEVSSTSELQYIITNLLDLSYFTPNQKPQREKIIEKFTTVISRLLS